MAKANVSFNTIDLGWLKILDEISAAQESFVKVGFQLNSETKNQRKGSRTQKSGQSMPEIAARNEYGTRTIPARPFMSTAVDNNLPMITDFIDRQYSLILAGRSTAYKALSLVGQLMTGLIQKKIRQIVYPPNSPKTIAAKGSSKPLIDFGQMIQSVRYVVTIK